MNAPLRYLSVCSGIEAATVAWHPLGWSPIGFAEIDSFPSKVLAHHYGSNMPDEPLSRNGVPNFGDFTTIPLDRLGPVDLLVGGTPCQAFSVAGKRLSLADARGNLSLAYTVLAHELARSHGLRWAVWENVPGVLSTDDNAFGCFLGSLVGGDDPVEPVHCPKRRKSNAFWRWREAGIETDDDGVEVEVTEGHVTRWPSAGMVAGPLCRATWRILDAQYFGLAQRRRRVFVVAGFGDGPDPAAVLFERAGVRWHPPSRGEARESPTCGTLGGTSPGGGWRLGADEAAANQLVSYGIDADCIDRSGEGASGGAATRSGLGVQAELAQAIRAKRPGAVAYGGNDTRGPIEIATAVNAHGGPCERQDFESETFVVGVSPSIPIPFDTTQITSQANYSSPQPGDPCHPLAAQGHPPAIAFDCKAGGDTGFAVGDICGALRGAGHGGGHAAIATAWAVRCLMPVETERLQGFPDGYTAIPGAADGPRYKTHGNSMAVSVMRWLGERIAAADVAVRVETDA